MQTTTAVSYDKVTFTIPHFLNQQLEILKNEFKVSKSEILKSAIQEYIKQQNRIKMEKSVQLMMDEYSNGEITQFTNLDGEGFR
jgi:metal-responsive CopG/Arc/MetJ family transcriptional regulator